MNLKILGSEPAATVAGIETVAAAVLALLVAFHVGLTQGEVGLIMAALTAVLGAVVAGVTHHRLLAAAVAAVKACAALAIGYGVQLTPEQVAIIVGAITAIGGLYLRTQTSPRPTALTNPTVVPGEVVSAVTVPPVAAVPAKKTTARKRVAKKTT